MTSTIAEPVELVTPGDLGDELHVLDPVDGIELAIGAPTDRLRELWHRHGARLLREDAEGSRFTWPLGLYGPPPGWTLQDERERDARRRETKARWSRKEQPEVE
ncbi:hypothetical protein BH23CHL7_BH23CHL7_05140 [soil metagenome]